MSELKFEVGREAVLKDFLVNDAHVSKRLISKLKRTEMGITRNGKLIRTIDKVYAGDIIVLKIQDTSFLEGNPDLNVPVVFENKHLVVFDKPVGMPVHPSIRHQGDTLGNFFAAKYPELTFRPVNRLDRDTSGLCVVAKDAYSAKLLQNSIDKVYYAVVQGHMEGEGTIDLPIAREKDSIIVRTVREDGQRAVTHYKALEGNGRYTLLEIVLETGRTHQIRVHFSYTGHPLAGDDMYGGDISVTKHQALHCGGLTFENPADGEKIHITSSIREDMRLLLNKGE